MNNRATYSCTALLGTNKTGIIKPDENGYYPLILGGLDVYNSGGAFYPFAPAKELFDESSQLQRRIKSGNLRGEMGHPRKEPGMNDRDFFARVLEIRETNVCCHFGEVTLIENLKDKNGRSTVGILGKVKPSGPMGNPLGDSLNNPKENVCFSIRSITVDNWVRGQLVKTLKNIVTWDYVNEPGIAYANKYDAPTLEHLEELHFNPEQLLAVKKVQSKHLGMGMESGTINAADIERVLGWANGSIAAKPASARW